MSTQYETVLLDLSRVASSDVPVFGFLEEAARILVEGLALHRLRLTVEEPGTGAAVQIERQRGGAGTAAGPWGPAPVEVAAPVEVRGRRYGRLELQAAPGAARAAALLETVTTAAEQMARFLELEQIRADRATLAAEARDWTWRQHADTVLTRAAGVLAAHRGIPAAAARQWIHSEARRTGRESWFVAERILRNQASRPRPQPGRPIAQSA